MQVGERGKAFDDEGRGTFSRWRVGGEEDWVLGTELGDPLLPFCGVDAVVEGGADGDRPEAESVPLLIGAGEICL
jgi:hypothetical protein